MWFLYIKEDVGYEEFLVVVYEAETEGSEGKVLNVKAKALTVEKIVESRELNKLKDLRQQIESLATIMESTTIGGNKSKFPLLGRRKCLVILLRNYFRGHPERLRDL